MPPSIPPRGRGVKPPLIVPDVSGLDCRSAAHEYLDAGFWPIPWRSYNGNKMPCYEAGWSYATVERESHRSIDEWRAGSRVGLITSPRSGLLVCDIDHPSVWEQWDVDEPEYVSSRTGRDGGEHHLYDARGLEASGWPRQGDIPGGQVKSNGFIGVAPSRHPSGRAYQWVGSNRQLSPVGHFAEVLSMYRASHPSAAGVASGSEVADAGGLWSEVLSAGSGAQRGAIFAWARDAHDRGMRDKEVVDCLELAVLRGQLRSWDSTDPWDRAGLAGAAIPTGGWRHTPGARLSELGGADGDADNGSELGDDESSVWFNFSGVIDGTYTRAVPVYGERGDGQCLFYAGKEHTVYGETESGKDMLLVWLVKESLSRGRSVIWIDWEEGDGGDCGNRLLNAGLDASLLGDEDLFMFATPDSRGSAMDVMAACVSWCPDIVIHNGVTAAYGVFGWAVKDNDSATAFRSALVRPLLGRGVCTIATDHVTKEAASVGGSRYAMGGVMKLNVVNGASYLVENVEPIGVGVSGWSNLTLTKDRPGSVRMGCSGGELPGTRAAGILSCTSSGTEPGSLVVEVSADGIVRPRVVPDAMKGLRALALKGDGGEDGRYSGVEFDALIGGDKNRRAAIRKAAIDAGFVARTEPVRGKTTWHTVTEKGWEAMEK
jgi:hypothetical protein